MGWQVGSHQRQVAFFPTGCIHYDWTYRLESCESAEDEFYETEDEGTEEETSLFICVLIDCLEKEKQSALEKIGTFIKSDNAFQ